MILHYTAYLAEELVRVNLHRGSGQDMGTGKGPSSPCRACDGREDGGMHTKSVPPGPAIWTPTNTATSIGEPSRTVAATSSCICSPARVAASFVNALMVTEKQPFV